MFCVLGEHGRYLIRVAFSRRACSIPICSMCIPIRLSFTGSFSLLEPLLGSCPFWWDLVPCLGALHQTWRLQSLTMASFCKYIRLMLKLLVTTCALPGSPASKMALVVLDYSLLCKHCRLLLSLNPKRCVNDQRCYLLMLCCVTAVVQIGYGMDTAKKQPLITLQACSTDTQAVRPTWPNGEGTPADLVITKVECTLPCYWSDGCDESTLASRPDTSKLPH